jgi:hypothetical protein
MLLPCRGFGSKLQHKLFVPQFCSLHVLGRAWRERLPLRQQWLLATRQVLGADPSSLARARASCSLFIGTA